MATDPAFSKVVNVFAQSRTVKLCVAALTFDTISTFSPAAVLKATFGSWSRSFDSMRTEPGRTNFDMGDYRSTNVCLGVMKKSSALNIDAVENTNFANNSTGMQGDVG